MSDYSDYSQDARDARLTERQIIEDVAALQVDTQGWSPSWHWDRSEYGSLTDKGWAQVLEDAKCKLMYAKRMAMRLESVLVHVQRVVDENCLYQWLESEDNEEWMLEEKHKFPYRDEIELLVEEG